MIWNISYYSEKSYDTTTTKIEHNKTIYILSVYMLCTQYPNQEWILYYQFPVVKIRFTNFIACDWVISRPYGKLLQQGSFLTYRSKCVFTYLGCSFGHQNKIDIKSTTLVWGNINWSRKLLSYYPRLFRADKVSGLRQEITTKVYSLPEY